MNIILLLSYSLKAVCCHEGEKVTSISILPLGLRSPNESLLVPQEITLSEDRMVVTSEHSTEEFPRPDPAEVTAGDKHLVVDRGKNRLVFLKSSFEGPEDFQVLKDWLKNPHQGPGS